MAVLLNKSDMAASLGVSVQTFDKYGITPVERRWREVFYDVKSVYCQPGWGSLMSSFRVIILRSAIVAQVKLKRFVHASSV